MASDRDLERAATDMGLGRYLLRSVPLVALGGVAAGGASVLFNPEMPLLPTLAVFAFAGIMLGVPLMAAKWWAARRDTSLTVQQQYFLAMGHWKSRALLSLGFSGFVALMMLFNPVPGGTIVGVISISLFIFLVFFCIMWAFSGMLRAMGLMPSPDPKGL